MDPNGYALNLVSVLVGLALTDMFVSLHKLARLGRSVRWDARVVLTAVYVVLLLVAMWFQSYNLSRNPELRDYPFFLTLFAEYGLLVMVAHACLPDGPEPDLAVFYDRTRGYLWSLALAFYLSYLVHMLVLAPARAWEEPVRFASVWGGSLGAVLALRFSRRRPVELVALLVLIAITVSTSLEHRLGEAPTAPRPASGRSG